MTNHNEQLLTPEAFAILGGGEVAYVREIKSEEVKTLFPQAALMAPGMKLFSLHAADGTPIIVTDSREAAIANAREHELNMVSVH
jgi:hypothetical protein